MNMNLFKSFATPALVFALLLPGLSTAQTFTQIRLIDPLDEPEFYCLDLSGWGERLKLDDPLQAHTCKTRRADDQMFAIEDGKILVGNTGRCLQLGVSSGKPLAGVAILARDCSDSPLQSFTLEDNGQLSVTGSALCLAAGTESTDASGPSHVWRVLSAQPCDTTSPELTTWQVGL
jgi:hypothetical protein